MISMTNSENISIFVVDDDEHARLLMEGQLKSLGQIHVFSNAHEAIEATKQSPPQLIISDIDMPDMSGLEFLKWIRDFDESLPVIMVSAFHSDDNLFKALEMGATDFICKPFPLRNIRAAARGALKTKSPKGNFKVDSEGFWVSFTFDSHHEYLRRVNSLIATLVEKKTNKEVCHAIRLAIEEIGSNAIEWGNKNDPELKVTIKYRIGPEKITLCIKDEGAGFSNLGLPEISQDPEKLQKQRKDKQKRIGGYGINLVTHIMDEVIYNEKGNQILMSMYLSPRSGESHSHNA
jgi:DNA-binding response OmpR family regulator